MKNFKKYGSSLVHKSSKVEKGAILENSVIGENCYINKNSEIYNSILSNNITIKSSVIEDSEINSNTSIGPFAHLRPNCKIEKNCKIGNFVEIKNSFVGNNSKISHLAYVGDAKIGENCNIGCGVIFCNYNGKEKNKIEVGNNVFVGSNSNLIAPLKIASNVYICAGTTLTENANQNDFIIGRTKASVKPNRASKYLKE